MRQIRQNTFETNSSSTHSLVLCTEDEFNDWVAGKTLLNTYTHTFVNYPEPSTRDYEEAKADYASGMTKYMKSWDNLTVEERKEYTVDYIKNRDDIDYLETYGDRRYISYKISDYKRKEIIIRDTEDKLHQVNTSDILLIGKLKESEVYEIVFKDNKIIKTYKNYG